MSDQPTALVVKPENIPQELKDRGKWCNWCFRMVNGVWKKPPITPCTYNNAKISDISTFSTFDEAYNYYYKRFQHNPNDLYIQGIGIGAFNDLVLIDLDHCVDADGALSLIAQEFMVSTGGVYAELSPSGTGVHAYVFNDGSLDPEWYRKKNVKLGMEMYFMKRYLTVTGHMIRAGGVRLM